MSSSRSSGSRHVAAVFDDVTAFEAALDRLEAAGISASAVSILGSHGALRDHFGEAIPPIENLADRQDTPREALDVQSGLSRIIHAVGEGLATVGMIGMTGIAYAVGGPVGIASVVSNETEASVEGALERYVDEHYRERFRESVAAGGIVLWVEAPGAAEEKRLAKLLEEAGGAEVHAVDF
jgi:hypothetical protein